MAKKKPKKKRASKYEKKVKLDMSFDEALQKIIKSNPPKPAK